MFYFLDHSSLSQNQPILMQRTSGNIKVTAQKVFHHSDTNSPNDCESLSAYLSKFVRLKSKKFETKINHSELVTAPQCNCDSCRNF